MKRLYNILVFCALLCLFAGCGADEPSAPFTSDEGNSTPSGEENNSDQIIFSAGSADITLTRAASDFPNGGEIGVVAAKYIAGEEIDWRSYPSIANTPAYVTAENNGLFTFEWYSPQYWPFDGSDLVFLAYSPVASDNSPVRSLYNRKYLGLTLVEDMPDLIYASANADARPHNKNSGIVDLGEFRRAMSRLTVRIEAAQTMNPSIQIGELVVRTANGTALFNLAEGAAGIKPTYDQSFTYTLINNPTEFSVSSPYESTVLLFPGSEDNTLIDISFVDNTFTFENTYSFSDFENRANPGTDLVLEPGKRTTLVLTVKSTSVENPSESIQLKGLLTDWDEQGNFGVTIN